MSTNKSNLESLLRDAIAAAREGDKPRARALFEQITELDQRNEKAWFWLASLVETDEERRVCLGNVITINPANERAKKLLSQLEARRAEEKSSAEEIAPGVSRKMLIIGVGVFAIIVVLLCGVIALVISNNSRVAAEQQATAAALQATAETLIRATETANAAATQAAVLAIASPTPFSSPLPPTWTPLPSPTSAIRPTDTPLPTVVGSGMFTGRLLAASGQDITNTGYVSIVEIPLAGGVPRTILDSTNPASGRGARPSLSLDGNLIVYTRYSAATNNVGLEFAWLDGSRRPLLLAQVLGMRVLDDQDDGCFSSDGNQLAFSAREPRSLVKDIFVLSLTTAGIIGGGQPPEDINTALRRLTQGDVNSTAPSWGGSSHLVYVADGRANNGTVDLNLISLEGNIVAVTNNGNEYIENNPAVSPDGTMVAFEATTADAPDDPDIYLVPVSGGTPIVVVDTPFADVRPRWSPDGRYLVYSSNRSGGSWEIYIVEVATYANYQVTVDNLYDMANDWAP